MGSGGNVVPCPRARSSGWAECVQGELWLRFVCRAGQEERLGLILGKPPLRFRG